MSRPYKRWYKFFPPGRPKRPRRLGDVWKTDEPFNPPTGKGSFDRFYFTNLSQTRTAQDLGVTLTLENGPPEQMLLAAPGPVPPLQNCVLTGMPGIEAQVVQVDLTVTLEPPAVQPVVELMGNVLMGFQGGEYIVCVVFGIVSFTERAEEGSGGEDVEVDQLYGALFGSEGSVAAVPGIRIGG